MSNDLQAPGKTSRSFWDRPEGTTGLISLALLAVGGIIALQAFLPILLSVLTMGIAAVGKAIVLAALCSVLAIILMVVTNRKFQTLVSYMFKSLMRAATSVFIEIDPIGIMKNYIDDLKGRLRDMDDSISKLNGQVRIGKERISKMESDKAKALQMAALAKEKGVTSQFTVQARQAGRLENSTVTLNQLVSTMELHLMALRKYREVSETVILDMANEVEVKQQERNMILASHSAMRSAMSILKGDPDKKELFDQAMEFVVNDYGNKLGDIEDFMINSKSFVEGLDLQNGVYEADALAKIQAWEAKADSILLGDDKRLLIENHAVFSPVTNPEVYGDYNKFYSTVSSTKERQH